MGGVNVKQFQLILKFTDNSKETYEVIVQARDEQHAFEELFKMTDNGWLFNAEFENTKFVNVNAAFEIVVVDVEEERIKTQKRTQEANAAMKNWPR